MPNYRKKGHDIQIVWLQQELTLLHHTETNRWNKTTNFHIKGHPGDALIIETTATEQKFYFLTQQEVEERFEPEDTTEDVYYDRVAPTRPSRNDRRQQPATSREPYVMPRQTTPPQRTFSGISVDEDVLNGMATLRPGTTTEKV